MALGVERWICLLIICNCFVWGSFSSEKLMAELELADMELSDACDDLSSALRIGILTGDFNEKVKGTFSSYVAKLTKRYVHNYAFLGLFIFKCESLWFHHYIPTYVQGDSVMTSLILTMHSGGLKSKKSKKNKFYSTF